MGGSLRDDPNNGCEGDYSQPGNPKTVKTLTPGPRIPAKPGPWTTYGPVHGLPLRTPLRTTSQMKFKKNSNKDFTYCLSNRLTDLGSVLGASYVIQDHYIFAIFVAVALHERAGSLRNFSLRSWRDLARECFCSGREAVNASGDAVGGLVKSLVARSRIPPATQAKEICDFFPFAIFLSPLSWVRGLVPAGVDEW